MDMPIRYFYQKYFLALDIYCYMYFLISFLVVDCYISFILNPLSYNVDNFYTCTIYCDDNVFLLQFLVFIIFFYFDIQLVYSPMFIVVEYGFEGTFPLAYPCVIPSVCRYKRGKYTLAYPSNRRRKVLE